MPLDAAFAEAYLASQLSWDAEPAFSTDEKDKLKELARAVDSNGTQPDAAGYVETYTFDSMNAAVVIGVDWKVSKSAELNEGDEKVIFNHWKEVAEMWATRVGAITVGGLAVVTRPTFFTLGNGRRGL